MPVTWIITNGHFTTSGAKGSIAGAELVDKKDAASYNGHWMAGSYIRPFTVELAASIRF